MTYTPRVASAEPDEIVHARLTDDDARPMLAELTTEYVGRYGEFVDSGELDAELNCYPPDLFAPPEGAFLLVRRGGATIGGGAFMRHDAGTVELKRIWTHSGYRRQGIARKLVQALEAEALRAGYRRLVLSTGFRQPEAVRLYLSLGYRALFDVNAEWETLGVLSFEKHVALREAAA